MGPAANELLLASRVLPHGIRQADLSVPGIHCGNCVRSIEKALIRLDGVESARVNLSTKRAGVRWRADKSPPPLIETLANLGFESHLHDDGDEPRDGTLTGLIRALAVSGFAAMNIMMLAGSVWAGADPATRDILHWICAGLALPTLLYSGRIFYLSAWKALRYGRTNMDVPISIGITLAFLLSLYDTTQSGEQVYFDASVSLVFFLLIGRTLDHLMRERARTAVKGLARMAPRGALVLHADGVRDYLPVREIEPGMTILLAAGERVPVDAIVLSGTSDLDRSLVSGESVPVAVGPKARLEAGTVNLTGPLTIRAEAFEQDSTLAAMIRLMEVAEGGRSQYRRLADRAAALYSPVVHLTALVTFVGWMALDGDLHQATTIAISVLIITCPCALGLAVPMVQMVAARRLFAAGIMVRDGSALERLVEIDTVAFDKTGTLTLGKPELTNRAGIAPDQLALAAAMAGHSRHPYSVAIARLAQGDEAIEISDIKEVAGFGIEARRAGKLYRLGRADWALTGDKDVSGTVLSSDGALLTKFVFSDRLRPDATGATATLEHQGLALEIISGDQSGMVAAVAGQLGVTSYEGGMLPTEKSARIEALAAAGHKTLMVGDGLNDAPALVAAHVSMAPGSAIDIGRNAADFVFLHQDLSAVPQAIAVARQAQGLVRQNFALAILYNAVALPIAISGHVSPFVAAVAMSGSSIVVVLNALRLSRGGRSAESPTIGATAEATP
ncbi:cation-translocating P-type ATPase [Devosia rhodophyticola]|uniref:Cation-translocating P-type ATPase n=2 Tax=Devosia rhodophyticola TaxID=3026423 RepID=A0ABY7Z388_9HYPH|nr:cation-translocating P-type ATPase [Devosia rhodophyticola]WDR07455.1 cation-translocating P-type ATPase [Devosia rhodophyticola]